MSVHDEYFARPADTWTMVAVTRPCFVPIWRVLASLPRGIKNHGPVAWLLDRMVCECERCMTNTVGGFWHWREAPDA